MQIKQKIGINICAVNGDCEKIKTFKETHKYTHLAIYLRGIEGFLVDEQISEDLKTKAKNIIH